MAIEESVYSVLSALAPGGVYPLVAKDNCQKPYAVYQVIDRVENNTLDGASGLINSRFQIDAYAETYAEVQSLATNIKTAMAAAPFANIHLSSRDVYESEVKIYRVSMDFSVWS